MFPHRGDLDPSSAAGATRSVGGTSCCAADSAPPLPAPASVSAPAPAVGGTPRSPGPRRKGDGAFCRGFCDRHRRFGERPFELCSHVHDDIAHHYIRHHHLDR